MTILLSCNAVAEHIVFNDIETKHWVIINDDVMGGISNSHFYDEQGIAVFEGYTSLENNGGFASIRRLTPPNFTLASVLKLTVKGDGRRYQFRLKTHDLYEGAAYVAEFATTAGKWQTIQFIEQDFTPKFRGQILGNTPKLSFRDAQQVGFLINDKMAGSFKLHIKSIEPLNII